MEHHQYFQQVFFWRWEEIRHKRVFWSMIFVSVCCVCVIFFWLSSLVSFFIKANQKREERKHLSFDSSSTIMNWFAIKTITFSQEPKRKSIFDVLLTYFLKRLVVFSKSQIKVLLLHVFLVISHVKVGFVSSKKEGFFKEAP